LTADKQLGLETFDSAKWLVLQTVGVMGFRARLGVRDGIRNWLLTAA
jgi:hypothetical protein